MQLADIGGTEPEIKVIPIILIGSDVEHQVGLKILSGRERTRVYAAAKAAAKEAGAERWDLDDPVCALELWVETVAAVAVDADNPSRPWANAEQLRDDRRVGQELLQYIYEAYEQFEQSSSIRLDSLDPTEVLKIAIRLAGGDETPLDGMRPWMQRALLLTISRQLTIALTEKSLSSLAESASQSSTETGSSKAAKPNESGSNETNSSKSKSK